MNPSKILVLQHISCEGLGSFERFLREQGVSCEYRQVADGEPVPKNLKRYSALISLGGPMNVDEEKKYPFLSHELDLLKIAIKNDFPTLGVCLGAQLIAKASGAKVTSGNKKEIGWYPIHLTQDGQADSLFNGLGNNFAVFQWHGDTFNIPKRASFLASSELYPNQAFRLGTNIYGLQFHVEVTSSMIAEWLRAYEGEMADANKILRETEEYQEGLKSISQEIYKNLWKIWFPTT